MNETTWLSCTDPSLLLRQGERTLSERKLRLFACACTRRVWPLLTRDAVRNAVLAAERYADGEASRDELRSGWLAIRKALSVVPLHTRWEEALNAALHATVEQITSYSAANAARSAALALDADWRRQHRHPTLPADKERTRAGAPDERALQCRLFRDLVPFAPVEVDPAWLVWGGKQVVSLARAIHDEERWQDMPVLADALEEAGCTAEAILSHCRGPGPHVRGCWLLDAFLEKEEKIIP